MLHQLIILDMKKAKVEFLIKYKETGIEIKMPVLDICAEYSHLSFSTKEGDYNDVYNGIDRLPGGSMDKTTNYDIYVMIDGEKYIYDGLIWDDYEEVRYEM